jgi:hypothetical protein
VLTTVACIRSFAGFGFPLFAPTMYDKLGFGKGDTTIEVVIFLGLVIKAAVAILYSEHGS